MTITGILPSTTTDAQYTDSMQAGATIVLFGFGFRSSITTPRNDVWVGTATDIPIPPQPGGQQMQVQSSSANDTAAGTGAQTIEIHYLDHFGNPQIETKTMNGVTPVLTTATDIRFVQDIHSDTVGTGLVAAGDITITPVLVPATVYCQIGAGSNHSLSCQRMVPAGKTLLIYGFSASGGAAAGGKSADIRLRSTSHHGLPLPVSPNPVFVFLDNVLVFNSTFARSYTIPFQVPSLMVVKATAFATTGGADVQASFEGLLVSNPV